MAVKNPVFEKRKHPEDWAGLLRYPPYYIYNPTPGVLQIWVKPRYFFAYLAGILSILSILLFVSTSVFSGNRYADLVGFLTGVMKVLRLFLSILDIPVMHTPHSQLLMVSALMPLMIGLLSLVVFLIYKRRGLIEVTKDGILLIDNPRYAPGQAFYIPSAEIEDFEDKKLYSRGAETGTALMALLKNGSRPEILRVYAASDDYNALCVEINRALGRFKKDLKEIAAKLPGNTKNHKQAIDALFTAVDKHREDSLMAHAQGQKKREKWYRGTILLPAFAISLIFQIWYHLFTSQSGFLKFVAFVLGFLHIAALYSYGAYLFDRIGRWRIAQKLGGVGLLLAGLLTWNFRYPAIEEILIQRIWKSARVVPATLIASMPPKNGGPAVTYVFELEGNKYEVREAVDWDTFQKLEKKLKPGYPLKVQVNPRFPSYRRLYEFGRKSRTADTR